MTAEDGCDTWRFPPELRKEVWPPSILKLHGTQHFWDLDEAVALQHEVDGFTPPVPKPGQYIRIVQGRDYQWRVEKGVQHWRYLNFNQVDQKYRWVLSTSVYEINRWSTPEEAVAALRASGEL